MITLLYFLIGTLIALVIHRKDLTDGDMSITVVIGLLWTLAIPVWLLALLIKHNAGERL